MELHEVSSLLIVCAWIPLPPSPLWYLLLHLIIYPRLFFSTHCINTNRVLLPWLNPSFSTWANFMGGFAVDVFFFFLKTTCSSASRFWFSVYQFSLVFLILSNILVRAIGLYEPIPFAGVLGLRIRSTTTFIQLNGKFKFSLTRSCYKVVYVMFLSLCFV